MLSLSARENRQRADENKKRLFEKLISSRAKRKASAASIAEPIPGHDRFAENTVASSDEGIAKEPLPNVRYGQAKVRLQRDTDDHDSKASAELANLVDLILQTAQTRERSIVLHWPGFLSRLALAHALASIERWSVGDKLGLRSLIYPTKTNSFDVLNHLTLNREDVLHWARELIEAPGQKNILVTRGLPDKDAYLFSLAQLGKNQLLDLHPTLGELLPRFSVRGQFNGWESCDGRLLEHSAAKIGRRLRQALRKEHCPVIGSPKTAPDAAFSLHHLMKPDQLRRALVALRKAGSPEVVLVDATRAARRSMGAEWHKPIGQFVALVHEVFKDARPGMVLVADEPQVAQHLKFVCIEACKQLDKDVRQLSKTAFAIRAVPCRVSGDGLIHSEAMQLKAPSTRNIYVRATDADAAKVVQVLHRYAAQCPGGRREAQEAVDAANFIHRLAVLPASVHHLMQWIEEMGDPRVRDRFTWVYYKGRLRHLIDRVGRGKDAKALEDALQRADELWTNYQGATAFALQLANAVGLASESPERIAVVFDRPLRRRMAERFLEDYTEFPGGKRFNDFRERVRLLLSSDIDACLSEGWANKLVFAGLDESNLRTVVVDERLPQDCVVLLAHRSAQYLNGLLRRVLEYSEFALFKPRIECLARQLATFSAIDDKLILRMDNTDLPDFDYQAVVDATRAGDDTPKDGFDIVLEGGRRVQRRKGSELFIYDPASPQATERGYRRIQLESLKPGDRLFDMSTDLRERVESALISAGVPIQRDKRFEANLRQYQAIIAKAVADEFVGPGLAQAARQLRARMAEENPAVKDWPTEAAVRHWVNHSNNVAVPFERLQPQAPLKREHYFALCKALRLNDVVAQYFLYQVIFPIRNARRLDGRYVSDTYSHMMLEPEAVMVHASLTRGVLEDLFSRTMDNIYIVEAILPPREGR